MKKSGVSFQRDKECPRWEHSLTKPPRGWKLAKGEAMAKATQLVEDIKGTSKKLLEENLRQGEEVRVLLEGVRAQCLAATDTRLMVIKTGASAGSVFGGKMCKTFPFEHVTSVDCSKGMMTGRFQVSAAGTHENRGSYLTDFSAENVVNFKSGHYGKFQAATSAIRDLMERHRQSLAAPAGPAPSAADEILKLSQLKDAGVITQEEFDAKKRQLLGL
jgi:Short C-terminal domain/Bacterial PH domain